MGIRLSTHVMKSFIRRQWHLCFSLNKALRLQSNSLNVLEISWMFSFTSRARGALGLCCWRFPTLCTHVHVSTHTHTHTCSHSHTSCMRACTHTCTCSPTETPACTDIHAHIPTLTHACTHTCSHMHTCAHTHTSNAHVCVHTQCQLLQTLTLNHCQEEHDVSESLLTLLPLLRPCSPPDRDVIRRGRPPPGQYFKLQSLALLHVSSC